jgi:UDP-N-acetylmuramate dehydrogenase
MTRNAQSTNILENILPLIEGDVQFDAPMAPLTWFRVGGPADALVRPRNLDDLVNLIKGKPAGLPVTVLGVGSNLLVRDDGIEGVVVRLGKAFGGITFEESDRVRVGAAALDTAVARAALAESIGGLEFLRGIPGTIGGALRMNAGAYGKEIKDVLIEATAIDSAGAPVTLNRDDMGFAYRYSSAPDDLIFVEALLQGGADDAADIEKRMNEVTGSRESSQPIRSRTGGSTFKNPDPSRSGGKRAWELIDEAGCRGLTIGQAQVSDLHCNFLINLGSANASALESLGETVRRRVKENSGVALEWEIRRVGREALDE